MYCTGDPVLPHDCQYFEHESCLPSAQSYSVIAQYVENVSQQNQRAGS